MNLFRGICSLLSLGRFRWRCLYCRGKLQLGRGTTSDVTHFDCTRCGREFEKKARGRLRQRWRTPLKEALFLASQSSGDLASLSHIQGIWREAVIEEVRRELARPSRRLVDLFTYTSPRSENELRRYLRMCVGPDPVEPETAEPEAIQSLEK